MGTNNANGKAAKSMTEHFSLGHKVVAVAMSVVMLGFGCPAVSPAASFAENEAAQTQTATGEEASGSGAASGTAEKASQTDSKKSEAASTESSASGSSAKADSSAGSKASSSNSSSSNGSDSKTGSASEAKATEADVALSLGNAYIKYNGQSISAPATKVTVPASKSFQFTAVANEGYELTAVYLTVNGSKAEIDPDANGVFTVSAADIAAGASIALETQELSGSASTSTPTVINEETEIESAADAGTITGPTSVAQGDTITITYNGDMKIAAWQSGDGLFAGWEVSSDQKSLTLTATSNWAFTGSSKTATIYLEYIDSNNVWHTGVNGLPYQIEVQKRTFTIVQPEVKADGEDCFWLPQIKDNETGEIIDLANAPSGSFYPFEYYFNDQLLENQSQYYHNPELFKQSGTYKVVIKPNSGWIYDFGDQTQIEIIIPTENGAKSQISSDEPESVEYDGAEHKWVPAVTDADSGATLSDGEYTVVYKRDGQVTEDFTSPGTITVEITGKNQHEGSITKTYEITKSATLDIYGDHEVEQFKNTTLTTNVDTDVTWTSSDPSVATIDASGKVVGVKEGTVTITATTVTAEGKVLTATHEITVTASSTSATNAWVFFQNSPTANPDTNSTAAWFPSGGSHALGIKLNLEGATFSGQNSYDNVANRVVSWPDGSTGTSWELQKGHATYGQYWTAVFNAWKSTLEKEQGTTITEDDVESITLTPYKISKNSCGYHLDCKVEVKCKKAINAIFYLQDSGSTGFAQYDAATYKLEDGKAAVAAPKNTPAATKTYKGVTYKFMGWYTDQACTQSVSFPDTVTSNANYYGKYVPMDQTIQVNYYLEGTTTSVAPSVTYTGLVKGQTITQSPILVPGYSPVSTESKTATAGTDTEINFYYAANDVQYTVEYYWNGTDQKAAESDTGTGKVGQSVTASPKSIEGYTAVSADGKTIGKLSPTASDNVIKFYYYKNATLTANSDTKTYNGSEQSITGFSENVDATFDGVVTTGGKGTNAGDYAHNFADGTINKVSTDGKYIVATTKPGNLHISPVTDEVTIKVTGNKSAEKYNGSEQTASGYELSGLPTGVSESEVSFSGTASVTKTDAGTYAMGLTSGMFSLAGDAAKNYANVKFEITDGELAIAKRDVKLTSGSDEKAYDGTALTNGDVTVSGDGFVSGEGATYSVTGSQTLPGTSANAFSYALNSNTNANNYNITKGEGELKVTDRTDKYVVTVAANSGTVTYSGSEQTVSGVTGTTYTNDKGVTFTITGLSAEGKGTDVGDYASRVTGTAKVVDAAGSDVTKQFKVNTSDGKLTINKKAATITAGSAEKEYDGTALTTDEFTTDGFVEGQGVASATIEGSQTVVGSSASTVKDKSWKAQEGTKLSNYSITTVDGTLAVTNRESQYAIVLEGKTDTQTYNGSDQTLSGVVTDKFTFNGAEFTVKNYKSDVTGKDAGNYTQTITSTNEDGHWTVVDANGSDVSAQFSVTTKPGKLTIAPKNVTVTSGSDSKTYDGSALTKHEATVTDGSFVEGEEAGVSYTYTGSQTEQGSSANAFEVVFDGTTAKVSNYNVIKKNGTLTVNAVTDKVTVTITEHGGNYTYDGTQKSATGYDVSSSNALYTANDFSFNGNATVSGTDAGTYEMQLVPGDFANTSKNFTNVEFVIVDNALAIAKRNVTLTSGNAEKVYDGTPLTNSTVAVDGDGFVSGEGATYSVTGTITNAGSESNAFTYELNQGTKADNYTITTTPGTLTVSPVTSEVVVTIVGNTGSTTYDGTGHSVEGYTVSIGGSTLYTEGSIAFNGTAKAEGTDANTYNMGLTAEQFSNANPNFPNVRFVVTDGSLAIGKRDVALASANLSKPYDGTALTNNGAALATETGWVDGQGATYTFTGSQTLVGSSANAFTYTLNQGTNADNYNISKTEGTLTVSNRDAKYEITVKANSATATYDGKEHEATGVETYEFTENGQKYTVSGLTTEDPKKTDAGTYSNNITGTPVVKDADGNDVTNQFSVQTENGSLVIDKATVTLKSADLEKTYDGTALTNGGTALATEEGWAEGEGATYAFTGSQTNAGSSANAFGYTLNAGVKESNYTINKSEGTLKVNPVSDKVTVTITENSDTKEFNNQPQSVEGYSFSADNGLYTESCFSFVGDESHKVATGTAVGSYDMNLVAGDFANTSENFTNVEFVIVDGKLTITPVDIDENTITWSTNDIQRKYDGTEVTAGTATATDKFGNELHVQYSADGGKTWVDSPSDIKATNYSDSVTIKLRARADYNTEDQYAYSGEYLQITQRTVNLVSESATKSYDGTALERPVVTGWQQSGDTGFVNGEVSDVKAIGSVTNYDDPANTQDNNNTITYNEGANFKAGNYSITKTEGTLRITLLPADKNITIHGVDTTYVYDGYAHPAGTATATAVDASGKAIEADFHIQYHIEGGPDTEWRDNPGEITWRNAYDSPVKVEIRVWANNFDGYKYGEETITITKRPVQLKTKTATKVYDGTPLTTVNDWDGYEILPKENGGFLSDELVTGADGYPVLGCTGSQTEVGSSTNTFNYQLKEGCERNYKIAEPELGTLTVTPQSIDPGTDPENPDPSYGGAQVGTLDDVVYNGKSQQQKPSVTDKDGNPLIEGVDYDVTFSEDTTNAGTVTVTITGKGNYSGSVERTYNITPKGYTVTTYDGLQAYNGAALMASGRIDGIVAGEDAGFAVTGSQTNVGSSKNTYEVKWNGNAKQSNYKLEKETVGTLEVTRAQVTVAAKNATKVYGEVDPEFTAEVSGLVAGESESLIKYSVSRINTEDEEVGTYTGVIVPEGEETQGNYSVVYVNANFQITKSGELTVIGTNYDMPYDGGSHGIAAEPSVVEGTTLSYSIDGGQTWSETVPTVKDVADIAVQVRATNKNYKDASTSYTLKVSPKGYMVTTDSDTKVYDGTALTAPGRIDGIVEGEDAGFAVTGSQTEVGGTEHNNTYEVKWNGTAKQSNYELKSEVLGTLTVTAQSITPGTDPENPDPAYKGVQINDPEDATYDGAEHKWAPEVTDKDGNALVEGVDYEVVYKRGDAEMGDFTNTGTITVVITGKGNYSGTVTKTYKIMPAQVAVTANDASKVYGAGDPTFTAKVSGLVAGEPESLISYKLARNTSVEAVGEYSGEIVASGDEAQGNYKVSYVPGTLTITAQSINPGIDPDNPDPSYGGVQVGTLPDVVYNGKAQEQKPSVTDKDGNPLIEGTDYDVTFTEDTTNAGTVTVTITGKGNYSGSVERTYSITPKGYTVVTDSDTKVYDGTALTAPGRIDGIVEGEDAGFAVTGSQTNVGSSSNTYEVKWNGNAKQSNYKLDSETVGTLTVTASGELAVSGTDYTGVYDGTQHGLAAVATVTEGTTVEYSTDGGSTWSQTVPMVKDVASVEVMVRATNPNYQDATASYSLKVTPASLVIVTGSASKTYDGSALTNTEMSITGLVKGDTLIGRTTGSQTEVGSSANTYVLSGGTADLANYEVTEALGTLTVNAVVAPTPGVTPATTGTTPSTPSNPVANSVARALADAYVAVTGEEATAAPEEQIYDEENPLGNTEAHSCWVHFYMIICMVLTALYGLFVAFRRGNHTHQLKKDMNDVMGDGGDNGKEPVATSKPAGTEA